MSRAGTVVSRLRILALGAILLASGGCGESTPAPKPEEGPAPSRLAIAGVGSHGVFDASLAKDPGAARLWMSYSAVDPSGAWPAQNPDVVTTRLAYSDDAGSTWTDSGVVNDALDVTLPQKPPNHAGSWTNEVSSLVYDPGAAAEARWKLLWHHYLLINGVRRFEHGWLGLKAAATPEGLAAASEVKLFAGAGYDAANDTAGGTTRSPLGGAPQVRLDTIHADLGGCVFTEPGMHATAAALYVSLHCRKVDASGENLIVLLRCASPCNVSDPASWSYRGTLLRNADAATLGFDDGFSATELFESAGGTYLMVTPVSTTPFAGYYNGCRLYRFGDLDSAVLEGTSGAPAVVGSVGGTEGSFNGACTYHRDSTGSGVVYGEFFPTEAEQFRLFLSRINF
jgi:hypothetical protein